MSSGKILSICAVISTLFLAGCVTTQPTDTTISTELKPKEIKLKQEAEPVAASKQSGNKQAGDPAHMYRAMKDGGFNIPAVDVRKMNPEHVRQIVPYETNEPAGTVVVEQESRFLYYVSNFVN